MFRVKKVTRKELVEQGIRYAFPKPKGPELPAAVTDGVEEAKKRIFNTFDVDPYNRMRSNLKRNPIGPPIKAYVVKPLNRYTVGDPSFLTDRQLAKMERTEYLRSTDRGPPKKGQGKRASKANKKR